MTVSSREGIADVYSGEITARRYVADRFASELYRLLHDRQVAAINRTIEMFPNGRFLEIAPGPGRLTREIEYAGTLVCLEYNWSMIREGRTVCAGYGRRRSGKACWLRGDAFAMPFMQCFDVIYSFRFLRHFEDDDRQRLYSEIRRVLRPGGWLVFDAVSMRVSLPLRRAHPEQYHIYDKLYRDESELQAELEAAGFKLVEAEPVQRWYSAQYRAQVLLGPRSRWLCRLAIRTLERLRRGPALEWIVTCRRE